MGAAEGRRPRVLLVAHHANPSWGSEPLIGWRWAAELDRRLPVTLVTHARNRPAIEAAGGLRAPVVYVETEGVARAVNWVNDRLWSRAAVVNRSALEAVSLAAFDAAATRVARGLARRGEIDVVHRVSPISPRAPSRLVTAGVPCVIGPVNGGMETAPGFPEVERLERAGFQSLRPLARFLDPGAETFRRAACVLVATEATRAVLPSAVAARARLLCENAVDPALFTPTPGRRGPGLRALYLGRLLPYKGVEHALRAVASLPPALDVSLDIVGDGPDRARLEAIARALGLGDRARFHGAVPVAEVPARMAACDVLVLPSVRESGGAVVLEAMACAKPVIVADWGGPAETVTGDVGVRVPARSPEGLTRGTASALALYAGDEALRERAGRAARAHVERSYTWAAKADAACAVYEDVIAGAPRARALAAAS